jgi:hypothetical protein
LHKKKSKESRKRQRNSVKYRNELLISEYKKDGCCLCGYNKCLEALDFHHVGDNKTHAISALKDKGSMRQITSEISKCIVICANCHREIHANRINADHKTQLISHDKQSLLDL